VRKHDIVASRLSPHHEVHALGVLLFVEEALGHWNEVRRLQHRVERAVADNEGTPCVLNPRTLFSCAVACGELGLDAEAQRLEEAAVEQGFQGGGMGFWLDPPPAHSHCCEATSNGSTRYSSRPARRGNGRSTAASTRWRRNSKR
jgi:hypothetical protein